MSIYKCTFCKREIIGFSCDCRGDPKLWNSGTRGSRAKKRIKLNKENKK